jgi:hypothetical protein
MDSLQVSTTIAGIVALGVVALLVLIRDRLGPLNAASWLVVVGAVIVLPEHPQFALVFGVPVPSVAPEANQLILTSHARLHFVMAGVYAAIGLGVLCVVARTLLRRGEPAGWFAVLAVLVVGAGSDLLAGGSWFQHGAPWYGPFVGQVLGFGWQWLDAYPLAWLAALIIAYKPIFGRHRQMIHRSAARLEFPASVAHS